MNNSNIDDAIGGCVQLIVAITLAVLAFMVLFGRMFA